MPANPREPLLQECRDLFRDRLLDTVRAAFDGMAESLMELADKTTGFEERNRYLDARDIAVRQREVIESQFRRRLAAEFQERVDQTRIAVEAPDVSLDELRLVAEDDLNETLRFNDLAVKMRRHCDEEMSALDQRAAVLLGRPSLDADGNPFGAKVVSDAFRHACQQVDCPLDVRLVFMKSFEALALDGIRKACREVNDLLVANAVLPRIRYGVPKSESKPKPKAATREARAEVPPPAAPAIPAPQKQDMFTMLAQMLGGANAVSGGAGGGGALVGVQLQGSLTRLQRGDLTALDPVAASQLAPVLAEAGNRKNVLRHLRQTSVGASMGQMDAMTLEIVSMLFDALFDDPKISLPMKGLIGRLQLPMLKVAIADKELFSSKAHPARRLLDALGQLGLRLSRELASDSPVFRTLDGHVDALVHGFQDDVEIFDTTRTHVEAMIAAEDERVAARMQASQRELEQVERLAIAKVEAQDELRARVAAHPAVPNPVFDFLGEHWIKYLVLVRARDGGNSDAWLAAIETTERLLWSVEPKPTIDDHRALTKAIPPLLAALKAGVKEGGLDEADAADFYQALMECHKAALRAATQDPTESPSRLAPPIELGFVRAVTLDNPFGGGKVEVAEDDLDFTGVSAAANEGLALESGTQPARRARMRQVVALPKEMVAGAWVTVEDPQHKARPARLHYVSPLKSHYLFVDRQGNKVFECSRTMLARRLKLGEVVMLDGEPDASLFDRILETIFGKAKTSAGHATQAGALAPA